MLRIIFIAAVVSTACACPTLGADESAIRGGTTDQSDPAVGALSILGLDSYCTASLIAPHTVLTAGHCNFAGMEVDFGTDASSPTQSIDVAAVKVHPMYTAEGKPYDFALMKLASDPVGLTPIVLNGTPITTANVGQMVRHVGYGVTDDTTGDGGGTKRTVSYPLNTVDPVLIYSGAQGEQTCDGDSGGPGFMVVGDQTAERLVGVVSDGPNCDLSQDGWDDRVDAVEDWIVATVSAWDAPPTFDNGSGGSGGSDGSGTGVPPDAGASGNDGTAPSPASSAGCAVGSSTRSWAPCVLISMVVLRRRRRCIRHLARDRSRTGCHRQLAQELAGAGRCALERRPYGGRGLEG
jgi:Trypsin